MNRKEAIIYLAAMIDGEGSISLSKKETLTLSVSNTSLNLIEFLKKKFKNYKVKYEKKRPGFKQRYTIKWKNNKAKKLLILVYPYLIIKKKRAELALKLKYGKPSIPISKKETRLRKKIYKKLRVLNQRGDHEKKGGEIQLTKAETNKLFHKPTTFNNSNRKRRNYYDKESW